RHVQGAVRVLPPRRQRRQRFLALDELIRLRPDHLPRSLELAVDQEPADLARPSQERGERIARQPLRDVVAPGHECLPGIADGGLAGPDEERPPPVPATAEILRRAPAAWRMPEEQVLARPGERLARVLEPGRCGRLRLGLRDLQAPATALEIDRDDLAPRRLQLGAEAGSELLERQREAAARLSCRRSGCRPRARAARAAAARPDASQSRAASPQSAAPAASPPRRRPARTSRAC